MGRLAESEAIDMLQAKLTCIGKETKPIYSEEGCDRDCDGCEYCYAQGTVGEQKESLKMAIKALEKQKELKQFIEKMKTPQYECFVTDRKGVVDILDAFLIDWE